MTQRDPHIWKEFHGGRAVPRRYIAPGITGGRILVELTKPHPSIPGLYAARALIAGQSQYLPDWVRVDQLEERQCSFRSWLDDVDAELRAQGYPPTGDLFAGGWRELWAAGYTPAAAVPVGVANQRDAVSGFYEEEGGGHDVGGTARLDSE